MSCQVHIDNIRAKTGKNPEDLNRMVEEKGFFAK